jgi:hypothetical protein
MSTMRNAFSRPHLPSRLVLLTPKVKWDYCDASRAELTWPSRYLFSSLPGREGGTELAPSHDDEAERGKGVKSITYKLAGVRTFFPHPRARIRVRVVGDNRGTGSLARSMVAGLLSLHHS